MATRAPSLPVRDLRKWGDLSKPYSSLITVDMNVSYEQTFEPNGRFQYLRLGWGFPGADSDARVAAFIQVNIGNSLGEFTILQIHVHSDNHITGENINNFVGVLAIIAGCEQKTISFWLKVSELSVIVVVKSVVSFTTKQKTV